MVHSLVRSCLAAAFVAALTGSSFAAGDVTVANDAGVLTVTGDDDANDLQIDRDPLTRELVVRGRSGTTINGAAEMRATDVRSISASLGGGNDVFAVGGFTLAGDFAADLGDGDDKLNVTLMTVRRRISFAGGLGDDLVAIEAGSDLVRGGEIETGDGADHVRVADSFVRGRLRIVTDDGDDLVEIHRNGFTKTASLLVKTGAGVDTVDLLGNTFQGEVKVVTGDGGDFVTLATSRFVKRAAVRTGIDDDEIEVARATFDSYFLVNGGSGTNSVFFVSIHLSSNGSGTTAAGGSGHSGNVWWAFVIVHVFP